MKKMTVLFDANCGLCRRCRLWISKQPTFVKVETYPLQSCRLEQVFPGILKFKPEKQVIVVSDTGAVYQGANAWIMILWAMIEYREWALWLADPKLKPLAGKIVQAVSENRLKLSHLLGMKAEEISNRFVNPPDSPRCRDKKCAL